MYNITSVAAGDEQSLALRRDGTVYMWGTTYIGFCDEEIAAHDTAQDGEDSENVIIADEYGYYRFPEPTRVRKIYWDQDERDYMVSVLTDITAIACGRSGSAFISAGRAYALGNTSARARRKKPSGSAYEVLRSGIFSDRGRRGILRKQ